MASADPGPAWVLTEVGFYPSWVCVQMGLMPSMDLCPNRAYAQHGFLSKWNFEPNQGFWPAGGFCWTRALHSSWLFFPTWGFAQHEASVSHGSCPNETYQAYCTAGDFYPTKGIHPIWGFVDQVVLCSRGLCLTWIFVQMELMPKMGLLSNQGFWPATGFCPTRSYHTTQGFMEQGLPNGSLPKWDLWPT